MHVGLLASDGCFSSALTALLDILSTAEAQRAGVDPSIPPPLPVPLQNVAATLTCGFMK
jgi:hypothetical protein